MKLAQSTLPASNESGEGGIGCDALLGILTLVRGEGPDHIFGRQHVLRQRQREVVRLIARPVPGVRTHAVRHSWMSNRVRRSPDLTAATGWWNSVASSSRLRPL
jgi:hypothetical protein